MITITETKTQLAADLDAINESLIRIENRTAANIHDLNISFDLFWGLPDERLLAVLNYHGVEKITAIFEAHYTYAQAFSGLLASRGVEGPTVNTARPRQITVNSEGLFELVPEPIDE